MYTEHNKLLQYIAIWFGL